MTLKTQNCEEKKWTVTEKSPLLDYLDIHESWFGINTKGNLFIKVVQDHEENQLHVYLWRLSSPSNYVCILITHYCQKAKLLSIIHYFNINKISDFLLSFSFSWWTYILQKQMESRTHKNVEVHIDYNGTKLLSS